MAARILVIEDERPLRDAFVFLLTSEGYDVEAAEHGRAGLERLAAFNPDLILLDMLMPVMNGTAFLEAAHLVRDHPATRTILLSNLSDPITAGQAAAYGVTDTMLKADLSPSELASVVKKMVTSNR